MCTSDGHEIGTATAWWNQNWRGDRWGQVHWVAIHPDFQGKGLCKPLMTIVMNRIRRSDKKCYLRTSVARRAALKVYLDFGFKPDPIDEKEKEAWLYLAKKMTHPVLKEYVV